MFLSYLGQEIEEQVTYMFLSDSPHQSFGSVKSRSEHTHAAIDFWMRELLIH